MSKFDSIFFDLDGTICDSYLGIENGIKIALKKSGVENVKPDLIKQMIGIPLNQSLGKFIFNTDPKNDAKKIATAISYFREYYSKIGLLESNLYPNILEMLEALCKHAKLYIITAKPTSYAKKILVHHRAAHFFNEICGFNEEENFNKADLINRFAPTNNSIMIGDKCQDIKAGKSAGIKTAGVLYGYGSRKEILTAKPDYIIENTTDLLGILI